MSALHDLDTIEQLLRVLGYGKETAQLFKSIRFALRNSVSNSYIRHESEKFWAGDGWKQPSEPYRVHRNSE